MRHLLTALLVMAVVVPFAHSRLTLLPSDDTAGGGAGDIYWAMHFGSHSSSWPTDEQCLSASGAATSYRNCGSGIDPDSRYGQTYYGTPFVRYLTCAPVSEHTLWGSAASLSVSVFSYTGSVGETNFVETQIGGALAFDQTDGAHVSKRLTINSEVPIANAMMKVKFTSVGSAPSSPIVNGISCTIALID